MITEPEWLTGILLTRLHRIATQRPLRWASRCNYVPPNEGMEMKRSVLLALCIPFVFSAPASADDMKQEVSKIASAYMDCFSKQDPACIAALYTKDGFIVNPAGKHEISVYYGNAFKAGMNKLEATVDEVWQIDDDSPSA